MELKDIKQIGPVTLDRLNAHQIYTPRDLLLFFPKKYYFYYVDTEHAFSGEQLCFKAQIASRPVWIKTNKHSKAFVFYIYIQQKKVKCIIFSGDYLRFKIQVGLPVICYGRYKPQDNEFSLTNLFFDDFECRIELDYGIPDLKNKTIQNAMEKVLNSGIHLKDELPLEFIEKYHLGTLDQIVRLAHFPKTIKDCEYVRRRVRYEDFFWYTLSLEILKRGRYAEVKAPKKFSLEPLNEKIKNLPFELTDDQQIVFKECLEDLQSSKIMNRLVQGDVGSGKSIVAFLTAYATILSGQQVAFMVPTEILAKQHLEAVRCTFPEITSEVLCSSIRQKEKTDILYRLLHGRISLLIGTHALLEETVTFKSLGLVIIDEQHRFGVRQRQTLLQKLKGVDALYLTATPIPRTLGLTNFGDLDLSIIKTMPKARLPIKTKVIAMNEINALSPLLQQHLERKEQIYVVVPLIRESDYLNYIDIDSAKEILEKLIPMAKLGVLHGKMKANVKDEIMKSFKAHQLDCLLATTVIEVGIDIPNATVMVIFDADRYGLSQIHQLRGRVGRGKIQSFCYLVTEKEYVKRLDILSRVNDGFMLAEEDFKLRGPGDYLGDAQSGFQSLNFNFDGKDTIIWKYALEDSKQYMEKYFQQGIYNPKVEEMIKQISYKNTKIN